MKKLLILAITCIFSVVLIGCSSSVENSPKSPDTNSTTARPVTSTPSTSDGKSDADRNDNSNSDTDKNTNGKSNTNTTNDGKSDADLSNSNK